MYYNVSTKEFKSYLKIQSLSNATTHSTISTSTDFQRKYFDFNYSVQQTLNWMKY